MTRSFFYIWPDIVGNYCNRLPDTDDAISGELAVAGKSLGICTSFVPYFYKKLRKFASY